MDTEVENESIEKSLAEVKGVSLAEKKKGFLGYVLFFIGSFGVVFLAMWLYVSRIEQPKRIKKIEAKKILERVDSQKDTAAVSMKDRGNVTLDSTGIMSTDEYDQFRKMELVEIISVLKDQIKEQKRQYDELSGVKEEKDKLTEEVNLLKSENEKKDKQIEYAQKTLPENVVSKLSEQETPGSAQAQQTAGMRNRGVVGNRAGTSIVSARAADDGRDAGLRKLAKIYEAMRAENAAPILANLDDDQIIEILMKMRQREAARILTYFNTARAARISSKIGKE